MGDTITWMSILPLYLRRAAIHQYRVLCRLRSKTLPVKVISIALWTWLAMYGADLELHPINKRSLC